MKPLLKHYYLEYRLDSRISKDVLYKNANINFSEDWSSDDVTRLRKRNE